jgi:hypothetical protein
MISGFHREVDENCVILHYYAHSSGSSLPTLRDNLSAPGLGPTGCPATSVMNYHYSLRNKQGERSSHEGNYVEFTRHLRRGEFGAQIYCQLSLVTLRDIDCKQWM